MHELNESSIVVLYRIVSYCINQTTSQKPNAVSCHVVPFRVKSSTANRKIRQNVASKAETQGERKKKGPPLQPGERSMFSGGGGTEYENSIRSESRSSRSLFFFGEVDFVMRPEAVKH